MTTAGDVATLETWAVSIDLDEPLLLGSFVVRRRDYVVVRLTSSTGWEGASFAMCRGAPIDLIVTEVLGPFIIGHDATDTDGLRQRCIPGLVSLGRGGLMERAISLVDFCMWDIRAKAAGAPLWGLLGGTQREAPVLVVAPYPERDERDDEYASRLAETTDGRFWGIKVYPAPDPTATPNLLRTIRAAVGTDTRLVIDLAWSFPPPGTGLDVSVWRDLDLAWIEDPYPTWEHRQLSELREAIGVPIAVGDEMGSAELGGAIEAGCLDVLRVDATTAGGVSGIRDLAERARTSGLPCSPHIYPELHGHFALACAGVGPVETYPAGSSTWFSDRFVEGSFGDPARTGVAVGSDVPGLGLSFDFAELDRLAYRHARLDGGPV